MTKSRPEYVPSNFDLLLADELGVFLTVGETPASLVEGLFDDLRRQLLLREGQVGVTDGEDRVLLLQADRLHLADCLGNLLGLAGKLDLESPILRLIVPPLRPP